MPPVVAVVDLVQPRIAIQNRFVVYRRQSVAFMGRLARELKSRHERHPVLVGRDEGNRDHDHRGFRALQFLEIRYSLVFSFWA